MHKEFFNLGKIIEPTILGLFFGTFGTTLGGIIGISLNKVSNKFLSVILSFASGLMLSVICFDLIPESLSIGNVPNTLIGIFLGIIGMIICDILVDKKFNSGNIKKSNSMLKTGIVVSIGLAIHNFPEGLAIGSGLGASFRLGMSLAIAICLHDIPEGISMALPMKTGGMHKLRVLTYVILSGVTTGIGAFFGAVVGQVSDLIIAICLSFAAGAMLYIVSGELIPEANKLYSGKLSSIGNLCGFIVGVIVTMI